MSPSCPSLPSMSACNPILPAFVFLICREPQQYDVTDPVDYRIGLENRTNETSFFTVHGKYFKTKPIQLLKIYLMSFSIYLSKKMIKNIQPIYCIPRRILVTSTSILMYLGLVMCLKRRTSESMKNCTKTKLCEVFHHKKCFLHSVYLCCGDINCSKTYFLINMMIFLTDFSSLATSAERSIDLRISSCMTLIVICGPFEANILWKKVLFSFRRCC